VGLANKFRQNDLNFTLAESGTGVGQVLAILCVAMSLPESIIIIDEPNAFFHPGAAKTLMHILKQYSHQYVISTHSAELISACSPSTIHIVGFNNGESTIKHLAGADIEGIRLLLADLGMNLTDVFGAERIIWVEGYTEKECFPLLLKHLKAHLSSCTYIVPVRKHSGFAAHQEKIKSYSRSVH
jgi:predicted ATP-dependent endonuclease of OLD family